jgi:hypothetical protein
MQRVMNSGLQRYMLTKQIEKHIDSDLVDVDAHLDDSLTLRENIEQFKQNHLIQNDLEDYGFCEEETELWYYRQNFKCKNCDNENMNATYYADHWIIARCECGYWKGFKGNPKFM